MKTAIYSRVSTRDKQDIAMQREILIQYCRDNGLEIHDIYEDIGYSGSKASRPAWDRLLQDMRAGRIQKVLIYKLDRIGRSINNLVEIFKELEDRGVQIQAATQAIDSTTPEGKMFRNLLMVFAEYERELTINRINDGLARAKRHGVKLGRPKGSRDSKPRRKVGYYLRHQKAAKGDGRSPS